MVYKKLASPSAPSKFNVRKHIRLRKRMCTKNQFIWPRLNTPLTDRHIGKREIAETY